MQNDYNFYYFNFLLIFIFRIPVVNQSRHFLAFIAVQVLPQYAIMMTQLLQLEEMVSSGVG